MKRSWLTRRDFIRLGGSALLLPFLPGVARAATAGPGTRLIIFHTPDGTYPTTWKPLNAPAPNTPLAAPLQFNTMHQNSAFTALADNLIMVDGLSLNNVSIGHGGNSLALTCGGADSFDHFVGKASQAATRVSVLNLRVLQSLGGSVNNDVTYSAGAVSSYLSSPSAAFNLLFSGAGSAASASNPTSHRKSVLDAVAGQIQTISKQLGKTEATKLASHLAAVRAVETSLTGAQASGVMCGSPTAVADVTDPHNYFTDTGDRMIQLLGLGIGCGVTSVASLAWAGEAEDPLLFAASPSITTTDGYHGTLSHRGGGSDPVAIAKLVSCEQWFCGEFAKLVNSLKAIPDPAAPGQTVFDNTIVLWTRSMGDGAAHTNYSMPFIVAAGSKTRLKTSPGGRYLNYGGYEPFSATAAPPGLSGITTPYNGAPGQPHQRLFATLGQAMGVPMTGFGVTSYATPGDPTQPLAELLA